MYVSNEERNLTVLKTSLFFNGDGFAVYDSKGQLVFRFDSYGPRARDKDELVLMDPNGRSLLTLRRKVQPSFFAFYQVTCFYVALSIQRTPISLFCVLLFMTEAFVIESAETESSSTVGRVQRGEKGGRYSRFQREEIVDHRTVEDERGGGGVR